MKPTAARFLHQSVVEVERKFLCNPGSRDCFNTNHGEPAFRVLEYLGRRTFEDTYYDRNGVLSSHGVWVRQRSGRWQAKVRLGGDYTNSQFRELSKQHDIAQVIRQYNLEADSSSNDFGLQKSAQYTTTRDMWKADNRFEIVLDTTDFGHSVGEVELQQETETSGDRELLLAVRQAVAKDMDRQIEAFMQQYSWAFPPGKPVGKLSAYFAWKRKLDGPGLPS
ncbi:MAG: hypothetical protein LQ340_006508 [Diploschistes diacapsis]|nr:MAG: hypothetical protein LQ340_006508 [Diploschistes diacapsis]